MTPPHSDTIDATSPLDPVAGLQETLREAVERHGGRAVLLCSFQKEESVLLDELLRTGDGRPAVRIVTIDTGVLFPETLQTWRDFEERFGVNIEVQDATDPGGPWTGPEHCCSAAKVAALESARPGRSRGLDHRHPPRAEPHARGRGADRTRRWPRPVEVQPAGPLDRQGPLAAHPRARVALQPAARPGL